MAISQHLLSLPKPGQYAAGLRKLRALPAHALVHQPLWPHSPVSAALMRREVRVALDRRINIRGGDLAANEPIDIGLLRDARRLDEIKRLRVRHYQFESELCRERFSHLLARHDD